MNDKSDLLNQLKIDRSAVPEKTGPSWLIVTILLLLAIGATGYGTYIYSHVSDDTIRAQVEALAAEQVAAQQVRAASLRANDTVTGTEILNAAGYITARRMATVSSEVMGLITDVFVEEGMAVQSGQILAQLDSALARSSLDYARAQMRATEARLNAIKINLAEAQRVLERVSTLKTANFSSEASLTKAKADVDVLQASLESTEADIRVAKMEVVRQQEQLDNHTVKAPFSGIVTVKNAQPGEIVAPGSAGGEFTRTGICTIVDMQSLEIEVDVNEAFIGRVFQGQKVKANLDAYPDWIIPASVIAVIPTADRAKATVQVRIAIEVQDTRILPDMGVKVAFLQSEK